MSQFGLGQGVAQAANTGGGHYMETASTCTLGSMQLVVMVRHSIYIVPLESGVGMNLALGRGMFCHG